MEPLGPDCALRLAGLQAPQETEVTAVVQRNTQMDGEAGQAAHTMLTGSLQTVLQDSRNSAIGMEYCPTVATLLYSLQRQHGCVRTSVTKVWRLLHPPPMEMKPSDPSSSGSLPIYETQRCPDTGNNLDLCTEVHTSFPSVSEIFVAHCKYQHLRGA